MTRYGVILVNACVIFVAVHVLLLIGGCTTSRGRDFPASDFLQRVQVGSTRATEVVQMIGEPRSKNTAYWPAVGAFEAWYFVYAESKGGFEFRGRSLLLLLDEDRVVQGYIYADDLE